MTDNARLYAVQARQNSEVARLAHMVDHMASNKAYRHVADRANGDPDRKILEQFRERFRAYRKSWRGYPRLAVERGLHNRYYKETGNPPQCVDIETAAVCDLACPFCYRQWITTPDKVMREDLFYRIIDQCAELGVPSVKLNWRGEPLLQPKLPEFVDYAKRAGTLETIVNTDAVTLTETKARALIDAGLDLMIYSFDGGSKETYEKMRIGRFQENRFETIYGNIRRFAEIRREVGALFPRTKIQMILTEDTFAEQDAFFELFGDCVDDVSVKAYTERGGSVPDLDRESRSHLAEFLQARSLPDDTPYWRDMEGRVFVSVGRLPCEQPYQRLMVTYDGSVSMCCYDWGNEYSVGYVDSQAYEEGPAAYEATMEKVRAGARGFELLANVQMPKRYSEPPRRVQTLKDIWDGDMINEVRRAHLEGHPESIAVCRLCPFKETYRWEQVPNGG